MTRLARTPVLLGLAAALAWPAAADARPVDVTIINTAANPANVTFTGSPFVRIANEVAVAISGIPTVDVRSSAAAPVIVQPARQPFQQFVSGSATVGESCEVIVVPAGKRLTIESFNAQATGPTKPEVFIRTDYAIAGAQQFVRTLQLPMVAHTNTPWAGNLTTLMHTGATSDPDAGTFAFRACVRATGTGSYGFNGVVSGWLE